MNSQNQFQRRQLFSLGTMIFLVPALRLFPSGTTAHAGRATWLAAIAAVPLLLAYLYFIFRFMDCRQEGEGLHELLLRSCGPTFGRAMLALMCLWQLIYAGFILRSGADRLIVTIYPNSSPAAFSITMGLLALVAALRNPRSLVRIARMAQPFVLGVLFLVLLISLFSIDLDNLLPITPDYALPVLRGSLAAVDVLACAIYALCFIEGLCKKEPGRFRYSCLWLSGCILIMTLLSVCIIGSFGAELTAQLSRPFFVLVRNLVFFHSVERVEALVVMLWVFPDFLLVSLFLYGAQHSLRLLFGYDSGYRGEKLTDLSRGRYLIWLAATVAIVCSIFIGPDSDSFSWWSEWLIPIANLIFAFIFLPTIYIVGKVRKSI